jgi:hypothetical protein
MQTAKNVTLSILHRAREKFYHLPLEECIRVDVENRWRFILHRRLLNRLRNQFVRLEQIEQEQAAEWNNIIEPVCRDALREEWPEMKYHLVFSEKKLRWLESKLSTEEFSLWQNTVNGMQARNAEEEHYLVTFLRGEWGREGRSKDEWVRFQVWREISKPLDWATEWQHLHLELGHVLPEKPEWVGWEKKKRAMFQSFLRLFWFLQHDSGGLTAYLKRRWRCEMSPKGYKNFCDRLEDEKQQNSSGFCATSAVRLQNWQRWAIAKLSDLPHWRVRRP